MELSIVMPCYEEAENLRVLLPRVIDAIAEISPSTEILVMDTQKPRDSTPEICSQFGSVRYVPRQGGDNYGDAVRTGISESRGKYVVFMDADGSHNPADIRALYRQIISDGSDIVIGSRYMKGGETDNPFILRLMSKILNVCYRFAFGLNVYDVSDSFRIYDGEKLRSIKLVCSNFDIVEEILIRIKKKFPAAKMTEIPIKFSKRLYGESKRDLLRFIASYLGTMYRLKKLQYKEED